MLMTRDAEGSVHLVRLTACDQEHYYHQPVRTREVFPRRGRSTS
jgi:hypothetical protein